MTIKNSFLQKDDTKYFYTSSGTYIGQPNDILGRGTYGIVYKVRNKDDPSIQKAIKMFCPETMDEAEGIPSTTLREINALKTIIHPNVMTAEEIVIPSENSLNNMFVVMELCKGTLKDKVISLIQEHLNSDSKWLEPAEGMQLPKSYVEEAKIISWQLLNALAVVHSRGVMHRDLKPVNIMWSFGNQLKLGDFGLARFVRGNQNANNVMIQQTGEVQTMWYRAPEVLLGDERYGLLVDDWSIGCVIAELFRFRRSSSGRMEPHPLFHGRSDVETLMIIFETLGTPQPKLYPSQEYLARLPYWCYEFPRWHSETLRQRVPYIDDLGYDLIKQLLCISPCERKAARFLLDHRWFDDVRQRLTTMFVPWYKGFEEDYKRMLTVDRLPLPRALKDIDSEKKKPEVLSSRKDSDYGKAIHEATKDNAMSENMSRNLASNANKSSVKSSDTVAGNSESLNGNSRIFKDSLMVNKTSDTAQLGLKHRREREAQLRSVTVKEHCSLLHKSQDPPTLSANISLNSVIQKDAVFAHKTCLEPKLPPVSVSLRNTHLAVPPTCTKSDVQTKNNEQRKKLEGPEKFVGNNGCTASKIMASSNLANHLTRESNQKTETITAPSKGNDRTGKII